MIESEMRTDSANWLDLGIKTNPTMTNASNRRETNTTTITTDMTENNNTRKSMHLGTQESNEPKEGLSNNANNYGRFANNRKYGNKWRLAGSTTQRRQSA